MTSSSKFLISFKLPWACQSFSAAGWDTVSYVKTKFCQAFLEFPVNTTGRQIPSGNCNFSGAHMSLCGVFSHEVNTGAWFLIVNPSLYVVTRLTMCWKKKRKQDYFGRKRWICSCTEALGLCSALILLIATFLIHRLVFPHFDPSFLPWDHNIAMNGLQPLRHEQSTFGLKGTCPSLPYFPFRCGVEGQEGLESWRTNNCSAPAPLSHDKNYRSETKEMVREGENDTSPFHHGYCFSGLNTFSVCIYLKPLLAVMHHRQAWH